MGRGNIRMDGPCEGLFYIDYDNLHVYRRDDPSSDEYETKFQREMGPDEVVSLGYSDICRDGWYFDEFASEEEISDVLSMFCDEMQRRCPSFEEPDGTMWTCKDRRVILMNRLFYICIEDNEWSLAVELVQRESYPDCEEEWMAGIQKTHYKRFLEAMKESLLEILPSIGIYAGPWTHGIVNKEEQKNA